MTTNGTPGSSWRVQVDLCNPGQFFGCVGLHELADRLWPGGGVTSVFNGRSFTVAGAGGTLEDLVKAVMAAELTQVDVGYKNGTNLATASRIDVGPPFRLRLDWWCEWRPGGKALKPWAGKSMESTRIALALRAALPQALAMGEELFDCTRVVFNPGNKKKVEAYYFDGRRGAAAGAVDMGFVPDTIGKPTAAHPAVELFCLVGLQRAWPAPALAVATYDYFTWSYPLPAALLPVAVAGRLPHVGAAGFRFTCDYRTGKRKHKCFRPATTLGEL